MPPSTEESRFRISRWPSIGRIEVPDSAHGGEVRESKGYVTFNGITYEPIPPELAIGELPRLDVTDKDQVLAFCQTYGILLTPSSARGLTWEFQQLKPSSSGRVVALRLEEVAIQLGIAQTLVAHLIAHQEGRPTVQAWEDAGLFRKRKMRDDEDIAWATFVANLNAGLTDFHARIEIPTTMPLSGEVRTDLWGPRPDLYSALCLQIWNLIVEDLPVRRCANETCDRMFVRQEGRADAGQYRTSGVIYCSKSCARAQANRVYRRKKRGNK